MGSSCLGLSVPLVSRKFSAIIFSNTFSIPLFIFLLLLESLLYIDWPALYYPIAFLYCFKFSFGFLSAVLLNNLHYSIFQVIYSFFCIIHSALHCLELSFSLSKYILLNPYSFYFLFPVICISVDSLLIPSVFSLPCFELSIRLKRSVSLFLQGNLLVF